MIESISTAAAISLLVKSVPAWLPIINEAVVSPARDALVGKLTEKAIDKGFEIGRSRSGRDEKEQAHHLELALKNAAERGLAQFQTTYEQQQFSEVISILSTSHADILCREALRLFTLNEKPDFKKLATLFDLVRTQAQPVQSQAIDATPYLSSFFRSLVLELFADPYFKQQISDVLHLHTEMSMQRSLTEVLSTLNQIGGMLADKYTPEQFEKDVRAYTEHIERTLRYLKLVGVVPKERVNENIDPELNGIFVPLGVTMQKHATSIEFLQGTFRSMKDLAILHQPNLFVTSLLEQAPTLVLLGGPGSGKSTATRHLAWSHAIANLSDSTILPNIPLLLGNPLPLRIELRRLNEDRKQRPDYDFLTYASEVLLGRASLNIPPQMFEILLERRMMLIVFDGLDEVATLDDRRILVEEIEAFVQHYPGNRFLVTSRPVGYELAPLSEQIFSRARVQPFDDQQIHVFLENWYAHVLRLSLFSPEDLQELEELYKALKDNPRLHSLAENPLLLTVITALHHYERLPDRRILVYDRCADLLLETWAKLKGTNKRWQDLKLSKDDQYACVAHLGFVLHERSQPESESYIYSEGDADDVDADVPLKFMSREIERFLQHQNFFPYVAEQNKQASRFLDLIKEEAGLIVERGADENGELLYGFVHRTFQEYFAAADIYERYQQEADSDILSKFLIKYLHDPHWHEVILLLFGKLKRGPATKQLRQILEGKIKSQRSKYTDIVQQDLFFVSSCLIEEISVENDLALLVVGKLSQLAQCSPFPSQRLEALKTLGALMRTRQYAYFGRKELEALITRNSTLDISTRVEAIQILYLNSTIQPEEQQRAIEMLLDLIKQPDTSFQDTIRAIWTLYKMSPDHSDEEQQAYQLIAEIIQYPNLSFEHMIQVIKYLHESSLYLWNKNRPIQHILLKLARQPHFSVEQAIQIALAFRGGDSDPFLPDFPDEDEDEKVVEIKETDPLVLLLSDLVRLPNLTSEQALRISQSFLHLNTEVNAQLAYLVPIFLKEIGQSNLSIEQTIDYAQALNQNNQVQEEIRQKASRLLLQLAQRPDLSIEQIIRAVEAINHYNSFIPATTRGFVTQVSLRKIQSSNLSFEEKLQLALALYQNSSRDSEKKKQAHQMIVVLAQRSDISTEQIIQAAQALYQISPSKSKMQQQAAQTLLTLAKKHALTLEQRLQAVTSLFMADMVDYSILAQAVQIVITLIRSVEEAKQFIKQNWHMVGYHIDDTLSEVPYIVDLVKQELLPTEVLDEMYRLLLNVVPALIN